MKVQRLRITFGRGDVLRYITHLDLMRAFERALKRAALPVAYSEGFTPHPQIALAAPLPVGATAEGELLDVFMEEAISPEAVRARLAAQLPPGLSVNAVEEIPLTVPSLQSLVREWSWRVDFPAGTDASVLTARVDALLARDSIPWELRREKETKAYDLRPLLLELRAGTEGAHPALTMRLPAEAGARPEQVVAAMGYDPREIRIHRLALLLAPIEPAGAAPERHA